MVTQEIKSIKFVENGVYQLVWTKKKYIKPYSFQELVANWFNLTERTIIIVDIDGERNV